MAALETIRAAISAASEQDLTGHARGKFALNAAIEGLDHLVALPEPWETFTDIALRRVVKPAIAEFVRDIYEDQKGRDLPAHSPLLVIRDVLALSAEVGSKRGDAIDAAADAAIEALDTRLKPRTLLGEKASDIALRSLLRPILVELAAEGADAIDSWADDAKPAKKPAAPKKTRTRKKPAAKG